MEKKVLLRDFSSGTALVGERKDKPFTARFIKNLNPYESVDYLTLSKAPTKVSGSTVTDLILWGVSGEPYTDNKYFLSEGGKLYRETSGGTWSSLRTVSGCSGEGLAIFDDYAYYAAALLDYYAATLDYSYLELAIEITDKAIK